MHNHCATMTHKDALEAVDRMVRYIVNKDDGRTDINTYRRFQKNPSSS